jgi:hypothetical protein
VDVRRGLGSADRKLWTEIVWHHNEETNLLLTTRENRLLRAGIFTKLAEQNYA